MTCLEAVSGKIEPYGVSDNAMEVALVDAAAHFSASILPTDEYQPATDGVSKSVALAAMKCLIQLTSLTGENIGGISQQYDVNKIKKAIIAIAKDAGLSPELVLDSDSDITVDYISI